MTYVCLVDAQIFSWMICQPSVLLWGLTFIIYTILIWVQFVLSFSILLFLCLSGSKQDLSYIGPGETFCLGSHLRKHLDFCCFPQIAYSKLLNAYNTYYKCFFLLKTFHCKWKCSGNNIFILLMCLLYLSNSLLYHNWTLILVNT